MSYHEYVEPAPFMIAGGGPQDSLKNAAQSIDVMGDEIVMLFGGRRRTRTQEAEPARFIDIYGIDGKYRRSLQMPIEAFTLTIADGLMYAVQWEPVPALVILRPSRWR
ncbi:MAG: hypothetical protein ACREMQ_13550 [Longimicrobiales bacterium]